MSITRGDRFPLSIDALGSCNHGKLLSRILHMEALGPPHVPVHLDLPPSTLAKILFQGPSASILINFDSRCPSSLFLLAQVQDQTRNVTAGNSFLIFAHFAPYSQSALQIENCQRDALRFVFGPTSHPFTSRLLCSPSTSLLRPHLSSIIRMPLVPSRTGKSGPSWLS